MKKKWQIGGIKMMNKEKKKSDLTLKIFALLIAILMWSYVMNEVNPEIVRQYPNIDLEFSNIESLDKEGLKLMSPQESKVAVKIAGKKSDMDSFSSKNIKALVDLSGYTEGQMKVPVKVSLDNQMNSIQIVDYEPKEVMITFDKFVTVEKNITVRTTGQLPNTYVLDDIVIKPETVLLKGPRSYTKEVAEVLAYIDLEGKKANGKTTAQIRVLDDQGNDLVGIEKDPKTVSANINIKRAKEVKIQPKLNKALPEGMSVNDIIVSPSKIQLKGDESVLDLGYIETTEVDVDKLLENKPIKVDLLLPKNIEKLNPKENITVALNKKTEIEKTIKFEKKPVEVRNLETGLKVDTVMEQDIQLVIKGDNAEKVTANDFKFYVDLKTLEEGIYDVPLEIDVPVGVEIVNFTPKTLKVKLSKP